MLISLSLTIICLDTAIGPTGGSMMAVSEAWRSFEVRWR